MSNRKKNTGIGQGVGAFFKNAAGEEEPVAAERETESVPAIQQKPEKFRTSVMLYPTTLSNIELLKAEARKRGVKMTMSDILNDAIALLAEERDIQDI